jgi:transcriptional regulator with XRE-family HTH domain
MPESTADYFDPEALERACVRTGLTRKRIAEALGVTPTTVSALTSGRSSPKLKLLHRIVEVLGGELTDYLKMPPRSQWKLAHYRVAHGYTQAALAQRIGVAPSLVSSWEQEKYPPGPAATRRLAELYGVSESVIRHSGAVAPTPAAQTRETSASAEAAMDLAESVLAYAKDAAALAARVAPEDRAAIHGQIRDRVEQSLALLGSLIPKLPPGRRVAAYRLFTRLVEVFEEVVDTK